MGNRNIASAYLKTNEVQADDILGFIESKKSKDSFYGKKVCAVHLILLCTWAPGARAGEDTSSPARLDMFLGGSQDCGRDVPMPVLPGRYNFRSISFLIMAISSITSLSLFLVATRSNRSNMVNWSNKYPSYSFSMFGIKLYYIYKIYTESS